AIVDAAGRSLLRIGLSATQKPIEEVARFLVGMQPRDVASAVAASTAMQPDAARAARACTIIDTGHVRERDLGIEVPDSPLSAVMSNEIWEEVYRRLAELTEGHRTTLIFVNTRRMAERAARQLSQLIGADRVMAHH